MNKILKFLVDESAGRKIYDFLFEKNYDVKYVSDIMPRASDNNVLRFAEKEERILITNDKDFGELIFRLRRPSSGVVLLRLRADIHINRKKYLLYLIENFHEKLRSHFIVITEGKIRIRKLK